MTHIKTIFEISQLEYANLIQRSEVLSQNNQGEPKCFLNQNQQVIKILSLAKVYRLKKLMHIYKKLEQKKVLTQIPEFYFVCRSEKISGYVLPYLEATSLLKAVEKDSHLLILYAKFLAELHQKNIYFRGAHLGNILVNAQQQFILIDLSNMRFKISLRKRARNIVYIMWHEAKIFKQLGWATFKNAYLKASHFNFFQNILFQLFYFYYFHRYELKNH